MNVWTMFRKLLPHETEYVGTVQSVNTDGTLIVVLPDGGLLKVFPGSAGAVAGNQVLVRGNEAISVLSPALTVYQIEV